MIVLIVTEDGFPVHVYGPFDTIREAEDYLEFNDYDGIAWTVHPPIEEPPDN